MALEITTVGAQVKYAFEATSGTRPTSGYTVLPDVNEAPEFDLSVETIDASNITDTVTRYVPGRQDPGGDAAFTLNHTNAVVSAWDTLVTTTEANAAQGKRLWFAYVFPGADDAYYWSGQPRKLGSSGITQNSLSTIPAHCVVNDVAGWATAPTA